ncbi:MAG TPA: hypothetical protein VHZ73_03480 [Vicinamibacterales bacterium]|nr:hypothetical protein [Vicinamibacterales bacterium]
MTGLLLVASLMSSAPNTFDVQSNLQALYDEATQAELQFDTPLDIDEYHAVRFTPAWTFVDASGSSHSWDEMRAAEVSELSQRKDWIADSIQKVVSINETTAVVLVNEMIVTKNVGATTPYKDTWVKDGDSWKEQSRAQVGPAKTAPYNPIAY